ncbi:MAG: sulfite exporter TauE/SafE family protein [Gammaproteobacteria bacterium]|nr:sulfite exporter TauE/SafE family protein [Gammaproteobacteria bacterium]
MPEPLFLFVLLALVVSAFIKGSLGLGFSTICLAILANVIELKTAISIVVLPSLLSNLMVMFDAGNLRISLQTFFWMLVMAIPGMAIGLQLLRQADNTLSVKILAVVLVIYGIWGWANHKFRIKAERVSSLNPLIGLLTGMVNGATGSQIFPIMPYLLSLNISKDVLVQTINLSFTLCSLIMLGSLYAMNTLDTESILSYSLGIFPVYAGVWLGNKVRKRIPEQRFRHLVMVLIIVLGLLLLIR